MTKEEIRDIAKANLETIDYLVMLVNYVKDEDFRKVHLERLQCSRDTFTNEVDNLTDNEVTEFTYALDVFERDAIRSKLFYENQTLG